MTPNPAKRCVDTGESLTLDSAALTRAAEALGAATERGYRGHFCAEWDEGDGCTICWSTAAAVLRAAEGLKECPRCGGGGMVAPGDCCPDCGGNGLAALTEPGATE